MAAAALVVAATGYLYATPYMALQGLKSAVERRDFVALLGVVDQEPFKASVKTLVKKTLADAGSAGTKAGRGGNALLGLAAQFGAGSDQVLDQLLAEALTPESIAKLQQALPPGEDPLASMPKKYREEARIELAKLDAETTVSTRYDGINRFRVSFRNASFGDVNLLLNRHG